MKIRNAAGEGRSEQIPGRGFLDHPALKAECGQSTFAVPGTVHQREAVRVWRREAIELEEEVPRNWLRNLKS